MNTIKFSFYPYIIGNWICTGAFSILAFSFQMGDKSWDLAFFAFIGIDDDLADPHESAWHNRNAPVCAVAQRIFFEHVAGVFALCLFIWRYYVSILIYLSGLFRIEYIIEAARLEGAGSWLISRSILLPLLTRTSMFNLVFMTVFHCGCSVRCLLYGAYPPQNLYFVQHYLSNHFARLNYQRLSAAAVL